MCLLFETISIRNGMAENLPWHQERLEASYRSLFGKTPDFKLAEVIRLPLDCRHGHYRCRINYDQDIKDINFYPYSLKEIYSLRLVEDNFADYPHKFANRTRLDQLFDLRNGADDVLIVKNGMITDTSFANIVFWDGRRWLTPTEPLLPGTCRARLMDFGFIAESNIKPSDLRHFKEAKLINAMRGIESTQPIPVGNITW